MFIDFCDRAMGVLIGLWALINKKLNKKKKISVTELNLIVFIYTKITTINFMPNIQPKRKFYFQIETTIQFNNHYSISSQLQYLFKKQTSCFF